MESGGFSRDWTVSSRFKRYSATVREDEGGDLRAAKCCRRSAAVRAHRHGGDVRGPIFTYGFWIGSFLLRRRVWVAGCVTCIVVNNIVSE